MPQISPMKWIFLTLINQTVIFQALLISSSGATSKLPPKSWAALKNNKIFWEW